MSLFAEQSEFDQAQGALEGPTTYVAVQEGLAMVPALLARWGYLLACAQQALSEAKLERDLARAEARRAIKAYTGNRLTSADVEAAVTCHTSVRKAEKALIAAEFNKARIKAVLDALTARGQMLMSIGANMRHENQQNR